MTSRPRVSNPSEYGFVYSVERPAPAPEVGWKEKGEGEPVSVNLYSENVVKEGHTTESVDRESIANLSSMKQRWENIFTSNMNPESESDTSVLRKKNPPKWEVRLPYKEKREAPPAHEQDSVSVAISEETSLAEPDQQRAVSSSWAARTSTESAIEREIRLAHERERMLKQELAERNKSHLDQEPAPAESASESLHEQPSVASYNSLTATESESYQSPNFEELAEADRGADLWAQGKPAASWEHSEMSQTENNKVESIIEREIRLAQEREAEVTRMRKQFHKSSEAGLESPTESAETESRHSSDSTENQLTSDGAAGACSPQDSESLIARELRQIQEREEEFRRLHRSHEGARPKTLDSLPKNSDTHLGLSFYKSLAEEDVVQLTPERKMAFQTGDVQEDAMSMSMTSQADSGLSSMLEYPASPVRTPSDCTPTPRNVHELVETITDNEKSTFTSPCRQETPIEREMRIARERENEIRRVKGLPELKVKDDDDYYSSYSPGGSSKSTESNNSVNLSSVSATTPRSAGSNPMKRFASNRLQQELLQQKQREQTLRSEGKIISTSEEHVPPLKYTEVAGVDKADGSEKRNFISSNKRNSVTIPPELGPNTPLSEAATGTSTPTSSGPSPATRKLSTSSGGKLFSYKEFKQTAESKIEKELREMREREEELKNMRVSAQTESTQ